MIVKCGKICGNTLKPQIGFVVCVHLIYYTHQYHPCQIETISKKRGVHFCTPLHSYKEPTVFLMVLVYSLSMMALIQQITLLLRISAAPNTVEEYDSPNTPVKIRKVCDMVGEWKDEIVVIGVRHKNVVEAYANEIRRRFPDRKLFVVTGSTTTLAGRRKLKNTLKESGNGILLCTQQCLPSSVNFEFVNKVIIPELHYNNARMSQFYMRFVRFTSTDWKDIYFVTYSGSIESNQMQMVLAKEKLNLFMKGQDVDLDEVYDRFGVDYDLMSLLMSREADEDGNFKISWGEQKIS